LGERQSIGFIGELFTMMDEYYNIRAIKGFNMPSFIVQALLKPNLI
jgi:hypothetical protein